MNSASIRDSKKQYYYLLDTIAFENGYDINGQGFVALSVPFKWAPDAVKFTMLKLPEIKRNENPIVQNKAHCRKLSSKILPEVERLVMCLEQMIDESSKKLVSLAQQRDGKPNDLMGRVERDVLHENVLRQIGYNTALHDVWQILSKRKYELWECTRLEGIKCDMEKP